LRCMAKSRRACAGIRPRRSRALARRAWRGWRRAQARRPLLECAHVAARAGTRAHVCSAGVTSLASGVLGRTAGRNQTARGREPTRRAARSAQVRRARGARRGGGEPDLATPLDFPFWVSPWCRKCDTMYRRCPARSAASTAALLGGQRRRAVRPRLAGPRFVRRCL
jgi:hypothetical protein